jgi:hypothetical protein
MGIFLSFVVVFVILLWIIIGAKGSVYIKFLTIFMSLGLTLLIVPSLNDLKGWPTSKDLPGEFQLLWIEVNEPSERRGSSGSVYLWIISSSHEEGFLSNIPIFRSHNTMQPRAYTIPYSRDLHEKSQEMKRKIREGGSLGIIVTIERRNNRNIQILIPYDLPTPKGIVKPTSNVAAE